MNWLRTAQKPITITTTTSSSRNLLPLFFTTQQQQQQQQQTTTVRRQRQRSMTSSTQHPIRFGGYEVTEQVFLTTPHSFALVNLKPLLPGHVLVCPRRPHRRLTALAPEELTDLFSAVQRVERMLARHYFSSDPSTTSSESQQQDGSISSKEKPNPEAGSFNIALQDGPEAGQTVSHVHVHVIPRIRGRTAKPGSPGAGGGDELYEKMAAEEGNLGGALWDREVLTKLKEGRPKPGGGFPPVEDAARRARDMQEMVAEAEVYKWVLEEMEREEREEEQEQGRTAGEGEKKGSSNVGSPEWWGRVWPKGGPTDAGPLS